MSHRPQLVVVAGLVPLIAACGGAAVERPFESPYGLAGEVSAASEKSWSAIVDGMIEIDRTWSRRLDPCAAGAELAELSVEAARQPVPIDAFELYRCIRLAYDWARATGGAFEPTTSVAACPERLEGSGDWTRIRLFPEMKAVRLLDPDLRFDLSGLTDGFIVDLAARQLARLGATGARLERGRVRYGGGATALGAAWRIPVELDGRGYSLPLEGRAVSTRRAGENGPPESDLLAVVALASSAADADALASSLWAGGSTRAAEWLEDADRMEAILHVQRGTRRWWVASASLEARLEPDGDSPPAGERVRFLLPPAGL